MTLTNKEIRDWIEHLKVESEEAFNTAIDLYKDRHFNFALFFCHLSLEKIIKAKFLAEKKVFAIPVHDLVFLIKKANFILDDKILKQLVAINTFNIRARYDDYKREFYKKATREYAKKWIEITKNLLKIFSKL